MIAVILGTLFGTLIAIVIWEAVKEHRRHKAMVSRAKGEQAVKGGIDRTSNPYWNTKGIDERSKPSDPMSLKEAMERARADARGPQPGPNVVDRSALNKPSEGGKEDKGLQPPRSTMRPKE